MAANLFEKTPAWLLTVAAMGSAQLGAAISVPLLSEIGVAGTAWVRLTLSAIVMLIITRARPWRRAPRELVVPILLGLATAGMMFGFLAAISNIPLGTAVSISFLGPLTVAAITNRSWRALAWPLLALVGVLLMTEPWKGIMNPQGLAFAAFSGTCWALYIVLTQRVGDNFQGIDGLAISFPVAALVTLFFGLPETIGHVDLRVAIIALIASALLPLLPLVFELHALRRLTQSAFGTLMAIEPAFAVLFGALLLQQIPAIAQIVGIALVITAGIAAERRGHRDPHATGLEVQIGQ